MNNQIVKILRKPPRIDLFYPCINYKTKNSTKHLKGRAILRNCTPALQHKFFSLDYLKNIVFVAKGLIGIECAPSFEVLLGAVDFILTGTISKIVVN